MRKTLLVIFLATFVGACVNVRQPIQDYRLFQQPLAQSLTASVGSTLLRMNKQSDLPNIYGGKDIYGGKVDRGYVEIKLLGISETSELTLSVSDISRQSPETTVDRYVTRPAVDVSQTVNIYTSGQEGMIIKIDPTVEREYIVGGVKITFLDIRKSSVVYRIEDMMPVQRKLKD